VFELWESDLINYQTNFVRPRFSGTEHEVQLSWLG
jgi:hypothetical protein